MAWSSLGSRLGAMMIAGTLLLSACGSDSSNEATANEPRTGGNLVDYQNFAAGDPTNIDPALASDVQSAQVTDLLFDGLTSTDSDGDVQNAVAKDVHSNSSATVWTFDLRNDTHFSNGELVKPSNFKLGWERVLDPAMASTLTSRFALIQGADDVTVTNKDLRGVVANDAANTLQVTLNTPYVDFPALVSLPAFSPIPTSEPTPKTWDSTRMVGNGPFRLSEGWTHNQSIKLQRNPSYYGGPEGHQSYLDTIEFRISQDLESAYSDFESGSGGVARVPSGQFATAQSTNATNIVNTPLMGVEYWGFNMDDPTVGGADNVKLRQAIDAAIDKVDLNNKVYSGSREVASAFSSPNTPGSASVASPTGGADVVKAKDLLAQWGKTPPTIKVSFNAGAGHDDKAALIVQNLQAIGINAVADPLDGPAYRQGVGQGTLQFFRFAWVADFAAYDNMLAPSFSTATIGQDNVTHYSNPKVDGLIAKARREGEDTPRIEDYRDAEQAIMADQPVVPLDWTTAGLVKSGGVRDLEVSPLGMIDYTDVWVDQ